MAAGRRGRGEGERAPSPLSPHWSERRQGRDARAELGGYWPAAVRGRGAARGRRPRREGGELAPAPQKSLIINTGRERFIKS